MLSLTVETDDIDTGSLSARLKGLTELRRVLKHNQRSLKDGLLEDYSLHQIFEVLFRTATAERATYLKSLNSTSKSVRGASTTRLSACALTLRTALEVSVQSIRFKTLRALIDHILETSLDSSSRCCEPLALDYAKSLKILLSHPPHAEHLRDTEWTPVCDFLLDRISALSLDDDGSEIPDASATPGSGAPRKSGQEMSLRTSRSTNGTSQDVRMRTPAEKHLLDEYMTCLSHLTATPSAPLLSAASSITDTILQYLQPTSSVSVAQIEALKTINNVLYRTRTETTAQVVQMLPRLLTIARFMWPLKSAAAKDEVLIMLTATLPFLEYGLKARDNEILKTHTDKLVQTLLHDYSRRAEKDQLQFDELVLTLSDIPLALEDRTFALRDDNLDAERNWSVVKLSGIYTALCDKATSFEPNGTDYDDAHGQRKRIRRALWLDEIFLMARDQASSIARCGLQSLAFRAQHTAINADQLLQILDNIIPKLVSVDNTASWALFTLASYTTQRSAASVLLADIWTRIWQTACRTINSHATSRAGCHLVHAMMVANLVPQTSINDLVDTFHTSLEVNGPVVFCEASAALLTHIVLRSETGLTTKAGSFPERVVNWISTKWNADGLADKRHASAHMSLHWTSMPSLILACAWVKEFTPPKNIFPIWQSVARAWISNADTHLLLSYLLLTDEEVLTSETPTLDKASRVSTVATPPTSIARVIQDFLYKQVERTLDFWQRLDALKSQPSKDATHMTSILVYLVELLYKQLGDEGSHRSVDLRSANDRLITVLLDVLARPECEDATADLVVNTLCYSSDDINSSENSAKHIFSRLYARLSDALNVRRDVLHDSSMGEDEDMMEIESGFDSQTSSKTGRHGEEKHPRSMFNDQYDIAARRFGGALLVKLRACTSSNGAQDGPDEEESNAFAEQAIGMPIRELAAARPILATAPRFGLILSHKSVHILLSHLTETVFASYDSERSEVAMGLVLDIMISQVDAWSDRSNKDLYNLGLDLYEHFTVRSFPRGALSPCLQIRLCQLLLRLLDSDPEYGHDEELPSVRTTLFNLLQQGELTVKHSLGQRIGAIFSLFTLQNHDAIFDDLQESLPTDAEWPDGIAIRVYVLANLGSKWRTLLRKSVYLVFETAAEVPEAMEHAAYCMTKLSKSLDFADSRTIFALYSPQLLYTWLVSHGLADLPSSVFGYPTLENLVQDHKVEVFSQILTLGRPEEIAYCSSIMNVTPSDMLRSSFAKSVAYSMSSDMSAAQEGASTINESRLRELLPSKSEYVSLVQSYALFIMAQFVISAQLDGGVEKAMQKRQQYSGAMTTLERMKSFSCSTRALPPNLQPSFRGRFLLDQLERLCRRASKSLAELLAPQGFVNIARCLIDTVEPALGTLHSCQVVQKIRLLIAFAGDTALSGYPLEMMLQDLRPFLSDAQCADDALGILHYLFDAGQDYLSLQLTTFTGHAALNIISMKDFMRAKQDSTTQESQYQTTVSKMQQMHDRLVDLLSGMTSKMNEKTQQRFLNFTNACRDLIFPSAIAAGNPTAQLMICLLVDMEAGQSILEPHHRQELFEILLTQCQAPLNLTDDALGSDALSVQYAGRLWRDSRTMTLKPDIGQWIARVLGRAYAATGSSSHVERQPNELALETGNAASKNKTSISLASRRAIVKRLQALLVGKDRRQAGAAEKVLRNILASSGTVEEQDELHHILSPHLTSALGTSTRTPLPSQLSSSEHDLEVRTMSTTALDRLPSGTDYRAWIASFTIALCRQASNDAVLGAMQDFFVGGADIATELFPYVLHLALLSEVEQKDVVRSKVSNMYQQQFQFHAEHVSTKRKNRLLLNALIYLLTQPVPHESIRTERQQWLDLDYELTAKTAVSCGMSTTALFLAEISPQRGPDVRRSRSSMTADVAATHLPNEILIEIFKQVDDPDSFYGVERQPSFASVLDRVDYEEDGMKALMLHAASQDASLRSAISDEYSDSSGMVRALGMLNLDSLTHSMLSQSRGHISDHAIATTALQASRRLAVWDIPVPDGSQDGGSMTFKALQGFATVATPETLRVQVSQALQATSTSLTNLRGGPTAAKRLLRDLAILSEMQDITEIEGKSALSGFWERTNLRQKSWDIGQYNEALDLSSHRETLVGSLRRNQDLRETLRLGLQETYKVEMQAVVNTASLARTNGMVQQALSAATYLSKMAPVCGEVDVRIDAVASRETANVLWAQGEVAMSVKMLQELCSRNDLDRQAIPVGRADMLAQLGHNVAEARLENPEEVITKYLKSAISHLSESTTGTEAGNVYFEFASFCDKQLQSPENLEDFRRLQTLRERKYQEMRQLEMLYHSTPSDKKDVRADIAKSRKRAKQWFDLDEHEYKRAQASREEYVQHSLSNYARAFAASDEHDSSVVRFFALWLENASSESATKAVEQCIDKAPSWKFVVLLNQQMSRLSTDQSLFQDSLSKLVSRICLDHPYHSIQHIFASCHSAVGASDDAAKSRRDAAAKIADRVRSNKRVGPLFSRMWEASELYHRLAAHKVESARQTKFSIRAVQPAYQMNKRVTELQVPPATLNLELRPAGDYRSIPLITGFRDEISIATGISAPKIMTARASDGGRYKQLFKGGNDDLRQDAIMEQVFDEASKILKKHKTTRQRNLHIRTYKVLPLSSASGIMEFVPNSLPLHDFVEPAHARYHPSDIKNKAAREQIRNVQGESRDKRVKVYQAVIKRYSPVLRHFFFERFEDPDTWFAKRLAYTRSVAAISILGHVLGLGDRHCHNILLDEKSGEVVHIDLGVAFEAGRVLPVPEVVPFRLTRDIIDGMGVTKTEGVFRRCCEFTMEALRADKDRIMTLLNVLRYDPLYSWTVSPLRAKRMQEAQDEAKGLDELERNGGDVKDKDKRGGENEAAEAERALAVVEKKLSKTLSTAATVNELIQQATDERNLAVLFAGWAAYS